MGTQGIDPGVDDDNFQERLSLKHAAAEAKDGHNKAFTIILALIRRGWEGIKPKVWHGFKYIFTCSYSP